ncbi:hypothetical protein ACFWAY_18040 [Rhodococcus sp. NPDC059968]|uniref:hypothetical protein n=1 Tax=Rhodococcus sp. NPDC059968 TaxID=3347017 RepID=UPI00367300ED
MSMILGVLGVLVSLAALNRQLGWGIQWGPAGQWVSGIATTAALVLTLYNVVVALRRRNEDEAEKSERARRRAQQVVVRVVAVADPPSFHFGGWHGAGWLVTLTNMGDSPIYFVRWFEFLIVRPSAHSTPAHTPFLTYYPDDQELAVINPGLGIRAVVSDSSEIVNSHRLVPFAEFTDDAGYALCYDVSEPEFPAQVVGRWSVKDAGRKSYPRDQSVLAPYFEDAGRSSDSN